MANHESEAEIQNKADPSVLRGVSELSMEKRRSLASAVVAGCIAIILIGLPFVFARLLPKESGELVKAGVDLGGVLAWPLVIMALVIIYRPSVNSLVLILLERVKRGASFKVGPLEIGEAEKRLPEPSPTGEVSLADVAILHTSWYSEKWTQELSRTYVPGKYYRFDAILVARAPILDRIESVTYYLGSGKAFPKNRAVRFLTRETDRWTNFRIEDCANGTFIMRAELRFASETLALNRFIDLQENGPRIPGPRPPVIRL